MKTLSMDLRERIVGALVEGARVQEVANRFCVSHDSVRRLQLKHQRGESLAPRPRLGRTPRVGSQEAQALRSLLEHNPNATIEEMSALWEQQTGVLLPRSTLHDSLVRVRARFKKNTSRS